MPDIRELIDLASPKDHSDREILARAYAFAEKAHEGQLRNSGEPYFNHVFETAKILANLGMDTTTIAAGLLHDTIEDTKVTEKDIEREFGKDVLFLVKGVTKLGKLKYHGHQRHVESLRKFFVAMAEDLRVLIIKLADRLHNLRTLEHVREGKRERIALESIEIHARLADRLGMGKLKGEIEDAAFPYAFPEEYKEVVRILEEQSTLTKEYLEKVHTDLEKELTANNIKVVEIDYRLKHKYSFWKKLQKYNMDMNKIYDVVALRVIVPTIEDCYRVLGIIHGMWRPMPGRIKDYIAIPKLSGYRSLHTTIFTRGETGGVAEIQIRTPEMHAEAAYGIAAHFAYKEGTQPHVSSNGNGKSKFDWINELKNVHKAIDDPKKYMETLKMDFFNDRLFILTPKGDVVDLAEGSTAVDFAYAIHSGVGNKMVGAKVNGKLVSLDTPLQNCDIVEIVTKKTAKPMRKWLDYAKTNNARKHIRQELEHMKEKGQSEYTKKK